VDLVQTIANRCAELGSGGTLQSDPHATIHDRVSRLFAESPMVEPVSSRELPRISVDLPGTLSSLPAPSLPLRTSSDLEVLATLGEGGMGRVFLARQHSLDREVAIKTVRDRASDRERAALVAEGSVTGRLEHPSIIPVHALGTEEEGRPVLVMKRVDGVAWSVLLGEAAHPMWQGRGGDEHDRLDAHLEILTQVCNAAHFAHSQGIVHRDIKPDNVLIGRYGEVYLADWGIATRVDRTQQQPLCGTPAYMSPEMVVGGEVDARTDVYLLGAVLHHVLMNRPRHLGNDVRTVLLAAARSEPFDYPPSVPSELATLANESTAVNPARRPESAEIFRRRIADYLHHKTSVALASSASERLAKLRTTIGGAESAEGDAERAFDVLAAETRFAASQALEAWSDNEVARRVLAELDDLLAARRKRVAELERLARDRDPNISSGQRTLAAAALAFVAVALSVSAFVITDAVTPRRLFLQSLLPLGAWLVAFARLRRHLLGTEINRRAVALIGAGVAGIAMSRGLDLLAGTSAPHMLVRDSMLLSVVAAIATALSFRWSAWLVPIMLGAATVAALRPDLAMRAFSLGTGFSMLAAVYFSARPQRT
jgi:eukaryotic-like serine/threonine-protein kinase